VVLLFDTETTGLDFEKDRIIEIGACITDDNFGEPVEGFSQLVWDTDYPPLTQEVSELTGISREDLEKGSIKPKEAYAELHALIDRYKPRAIVAYNAEFDRRMIMADLKRGPYPCEFLPGFVCAMNDLESNRQFKCWKLSHIALDYGLAVDPTDLHRALDDVFLMRRVLEKAGATVDSLLEYQNSPEVVITAVTPSFRDDVGGKKRELAKKAGFTWQTPRGSEEFFEKRWVKKIKFKDLQKEEENCLLPIRIVK